MKTFLKILIGLLALAVAVYVIYLEFTANNQADEAPVTLLTLSSIPNGYPDIIEDEEIVLHSAFHISYNNTYEQANWAAYILTAEMVRIEEAERNSGFRKDPLVTKETANTDDYTNSGYDRGHLVPAADMNFSEITMKESFYMSNVSPQVPEFNRGIWKSLETQVRKWATQNDSIYVITGPIFKRQPIKYLNNNVVAVPDYFFKIVLDISFKDGYKGIAFILENKDYEEEFWDYATTIDATEEFTGIDFFVEQPVPSIEIIESELQLRKWRL